MSFPLMPRGTAVWLIENTKLTFEQIADFCGLHRLEVQSLADMDSSQQVLGIDPISQGELTTQDLQLCEQDPSARLVLCTPKQHVPPKKRSKYTPISRRGDRPDAIAWMLKYFPHISDGNIARLLGTTKNMVLSIKEKKHWNMANIKPQNPVQIGLCSQEDLDLLMPHDL